MFFFSEKRSAKIDIISSEYNLSGSCFLASSRYSTEIKEEVEQTDFGYTINDTIFSGYHINFGVKFQVNSDRRINSTQVKLDVIDVIKDFFKIDKMQFRQSINLNDLQYNILGLEGVIGIKELRLFQRGNDIGVNRNLVYYRADGTLSNDGESGYGFEYNFQNALVDGVIRPSVTPSVFELKNSNKDIYGKVI